MKKNIKTLRFVDALNEVEKNDYSILSTVEINKESDLVIFEFGELGETSAAVIYADGTVFTLWDWQGEYPERVEDIPQFVWRLGVTEERAFVINNLPCYI